MGDRNLKARLENLGLTEESVTIDFFVGSTIEHPEAKQAAALILLIASEKGDLCGFTISEMMIRLKQLEDKGCMFALPTVATGCNFLVKNGALESWQQGGVMHIRPTQVLLDAVEPPEDTME